MSNHIEKRKQVFKVRNIDITVVADALVDDQSNEIVFDYNLDNQAINMAFNEYRRNHHIVTPEEIVEFRNKYKLSQRALAKLLGIGSATVARYEKGSLPTESISNLLQQFINDESSFTSFFEINKANLSDDEQEKVKNVLLGMKNELKEDLILKAYLLSNENNHPNINDGFTKFDFNKFKNMVIYFTNTTKGLSKTRLNKLLFYSDFTFFQQSTTSISGATYIHDHYGPVPNDFELLYSVLKDDGIIDFVPFNNGHGEELRTNKSINSSIFNNDELYVLKKISKKFDGFNANKITEYSHKESAYKETKSKKFISYEYAFDLN
ncbi:type II TA system antitoxin MqsA family protein [Companilactobacillus sp. HBUAS59699]|uniref:type II TA system antitoxin MqsA family protein n=1 Tax=Companilactobacillus sp. HBUAS59699 TaxID=3109358 RepID=UPI002FEF1FF6